MVCQPTKAYAAKTSCEYQTSATRELSSKATTDPCTPMCLYTTTHFHTLAHSPLPYHCRRFHSHPSHSLLLTLLPLTPHIHLSPLSPSPLTSTPHPCPPHPSPLSPSPLTPTPHPSHPPLTPQIHPSPLTPHIHPSPLTSTPHPSNPPLTPHIHLSPLKSTPHPSPLTSTAHPSHPPLTSHIHPSPLTLVIHCCLLEPILVSEAGGDLGPASEEVHNTGCVCVCVCLSKCKPLSMCGQVQHAHVLMHLVLGYRSVTIST